MADLRSAATVHATITADGGMLLDVRGRGRWYVLTGSGALWWRGITEGADADEAADAVAAHFGADPERVRADMRVLCRQLRDRRLLRSIDGGWHR